MNARFAQTTIHAEIVDATDMAVRILHDGEAHWVPRSVCLEGDALDVGDADVVIADWWLEKEGLL